MPIDPLRKTKSATLHKPPGEPRLSRTRRPQTLPVAFDGGPYMGLGLWQWPLAALAFEFALFAVAVVVYLRTTANTGRSRGWALYGLFGFLVVIQFANVFGPPPPSMTPVAWSGMAT